MINAPARVWSVPLADMSRPGASERIDTRCIIANFAAPVNANPIRRHNLTSIPVRGLHFDISQTASGAVGDFLISRPLCRTSRRDQRMHTLSPASDQIRAPFSGPKRFFSCLRKPRKTPPKAGATSRGGTFVSRPHAVAACAKRSSIGAQISQGIQRRHSGKSAGRCAAE